MTTLPVPTDLNAAQSAERLDFKIAPALIRTLIENESSTLIRALSEAVMNSVDAGATGVSIEYTESSRTHALGETPDVPATLTIRDDGRGITSRAEIEAYFQTLGFDHRTDAERKKERTFGAFGLGRMQMFAFGAVTWRTNEFQLDVDLSGGLSFQLQSGLEPVAGMVVSVVLSKARYTWHLAREIEAHLKYLNFPVNFNGEALDIGPHQAKWTHSDEHAHYLLTGDAGVMVFNLGIEVGNFGAVHFGTGGIISTRVPLKLNISRNVTVTDDTNWQAITDTMHRLAATRLEGMAKMSEIDVARAIRVVTEGQHEKDYPPAHVQKLQIAQDVTGKLYTLEQLLTAIDERKIVGLTPHIGDAAHDRLHQQGLALVLHPSTLTRLYCRDLYDVKGRLYSLTQYAKPPNADLWRGAAFSDDLPADVQPQEEHYQLVENDALSLPERLLIEAVFNAQDDLTCEADFEVSPRRIFMGESPHALGWTNGTSHIAVERRMFTTAQGQHRALMSALAALLAHELCHTERSDGSHVHDAQFYARYHDLTMTAAFSSLAAEIEDGWRSRLIHHGEQVPHELMPTVETGGSLHGELRTLSSFCKNAIGLQCVRDVRWPRDMWMVIQPSSTVPSVRFWDGQRMVRQGKWAAGPNGEKFRFYRHGVTDVEFHAEVWVRASAQVARPLFDLFWKHTGQQTARQARQQVKDHARRKVIKEQHGREQEEREKYKREREGGLLSASAPDALEPETSSGTVEDHRPAPAENGS